MFASARGLPRLGPLPRVGHACCGLPRMHGLRVRARCARVGRVARVIRFSVYLELEIAFLFHF
jgi:hypothetical protein